MGIVSNKIMTPNTKDFFFISVQKIIMITISFAEYSLNHVFFFYRSFSDDLS